VAVFIYMRDIIKRILNESTSGGINRERIKRVAPLLAKQLLSTTFSMDQRFYAELDYDGDRYSGESEPYGIDFEELQDAMYIRIWFPPFAEDPTGYEQSHTSIKSDKAMSKRVIQTMRVFGIYVVDEYSDAIRVTFHIEDVEYPSEHTYTNPRIDLDALDS
jgi:hypothetical protein